MAPEPTELRFERAIDFPASIVFDALIDPDLVGGWLAHAEVEPRAGGRFDLVWLTSSSFPPTQGTITEVSPPEALKDPAVLEVSTDNRGVFRFELGAKEGGTMGSSTLLTLTVAAAVDSVFIPRVIADWQTSLDQLEGLLRGHPVDWARWDDDRGQSWKAYHFAAGGR